MSETSPGFWASVYDRWASLRVQALLFTILPLAIMLALAVGSVFYAYQQVAEKLARSRDQELARVSADRLSENTAGFVRVLTTLSNLVSQAKGLSSFHFSLLIPSLARGERLRGLMDSSLSPRMISFFKRP